jgi:glutaredoxin 3
VKEFLSKKGVPYQDFDVAENLSAREEMLNKTGSMSVPTLVIDGETMIGFDRGKLEQMFH